MDMLDAMEFENKQEIKTIKDQTENPFEKKK